MATSKQIENGDDPDSDWAQGYGYQMWRCRHNAVRGDGMYGQFCIIHKETDTVLAMTAVTSDMQGEMNAYYDEVLLKYQDEPLSEDEKTMEVLKKRLNDEGAGQLLTNCKQLKMTATDGKKRLTDVADTERLLRIIQSIPSPKAEPFKLWLAQVGRERIEETIDPELTIERALETYLKKGYSREWINQRLQAIQYAKS